MKIKLLFATRNSHKVNEIRSLLSAGFEIIGLSDIECHEDIPETSDTIRANAIQKAKYVLENYAIDCFADDTGLEVDALNGAPGVRSARYAGEQNDSEANMDKLLKNLENESNRKARFKTVICLMINGKQELFTGIAEGQILKSRQGGQGFGYDPIFLPDGCDRSFAEMTIDEKNEISHRSQAFRKMIDYLQNLK